MWKFCGKAQNFHTRKLVKTSAFLAVWFNRYTLHTNHLTCLSFSLEILKVILLFFPSSSTLYKYANVHIFRSSAKAWFWLNFISNAGGVFRTLPNIYNGSSLWKQFTSFSRSLSSLEISIADIWQGFKYAFAIIHFDHKRKQKTSFKHPTELCSSSFCV